jgi:phosphatidylserine/phosphatidylglycerophosphate/cardiolipin synthase-like enzyme
MVRVILEPSVYLLPKINKKAYALLSDAGVSVKYSSERDFNFNHSKYFIIDQILLLGTGNMTKSSLLQNREFFIATDSVAEVNYTVSLFEHDAEHMPMFVPENSLVISPLNARSAIQGFISSARQSITLMSESLSDTQTVDLLVAAKLRRLTVSVCLPDDRPL